jgi:rubredoxin
MIEVDLATQFVLYLFGSLALLLLAWIVYERGHKAPHVQPSDERIFRCTICAHVYLDDRDTRYSRCPQCGSMNDFGNRPEV